MLRYWAFAVAVGAALAVASQAQAQSGFYLGGHVGFNFAGESDLKDDALVSGTDLAALDFASGTAVGGAIGYALDPVRIELEITYRENEIDSVTFFSPVGTLPASGDVESLAFLANIYFDLDIAGPITPYAGAGGGFVVVSFDDVTDSNGLLFDGDNLAPAGQLVAGAAIELTSNLSATLDYRYLSANPMRLTFNPAYPDGSIAGRRFDIDYRSHALMLGMRIGF